MDRAVDGVAGRRGVPPDLSTSLHVHGIEKNIWDALMKNPHVATIISKVPDGGACAGTSRRSGRKVRAQFGHGTRASGSFERDRFNLPQARCVAGRPAWELSTIWTDISECVSAQLCTSELLHVVLSDTQCVL